MFIETDTTGNNLIIKIRGRIGGESSIVFYKQVKEIAADHPEKNVVIDFEKVDFIDSSGLGSLVAINSHLIKTGRTLTLAAVPDNLTGLLKITNLSAILTIVGKVDDAVSN